MDVTHGAWCAAGNQLIMAELDRPFADKPCMILPSKKSRAEHDLLLMKREGYLQREPDRQKRCRRWNRHDNLVHTHRSGIETL